ncbi:hypothetical protein ACH4VM_19600 [Streptomyces sp. NPDC020792]|uniref:hypothetical protein n=1 Tax=Streptomyces sp. NPDC020792 TaxID=3365089 RepID=UPI00379CF096
MQAVVRIRPHQIEHGEPRIRGRVLLHRPVHGDQGRHLQVPIALIPVVKSTEGAWPGGLGADEDPVQRQHVPQAELRIAVAGEVQTAVEQRYIDARRLPPLEPLRQEPEHMIGVGSGQRRRVGTPRGESVGDRGAVSDEGFVRREADHAGDELPVGFL